MEISKGYKDLLIKAISVQSEEPNKDFLIEFMEENNLSCLRDASIQQLEQYIEKKGW